MPIYSKRVQKNLRKMITDSGMSVEKVAFGSGVSKGAMSNYWNGKRTPTVEILEKISDYLKRDFLDFFR